MQIDIKNTLTISDLKFQKGTLTYFIILRVEKK